MIVSCLFLNSSTSPDCFACETKFSFEYKMIQANFFQVRSARMVTDKMHDIIGGLFTRTELSEVLTEIVKMDPTFCKEQFLKDCERDIIPNILVKI